MQQLLALNPTDLPIPPLIEQLQGLAGGLTFPDLGAFPASPALPDLSMLSTAATQFQQMAESFGGGPEALASGLMSQLNGLSSGSTQVDGLFGSLASSTSSLAELPTQLPRFFNSFTDSILPIFDSLQPQQVNSAYLGQLFQFDSLASNLSGQFNAVLQPPTQSINSIATALAPLADTAFFTAYRQALADPSRLDSATIRQIQQGASTLNQQLQGATTALNSFDTLVQSLEAQLSGALQQVFKLIDPASLGGALTFFNPALAALDQFKLDGLVASIEQAAQAVDQLLAQGIDTAVAAITQGVDTIVQGVTAAKDALVQLSAVISDLLGQLKTFISQLNLAALVDQVRAAFNSFASTINQALDQVNQLIGKVFSFIGELVATIDRLDFKPVVQKLHEILAQITALLDHPQVRQTVEQVKTVIAQIAARLDSVTLKPVFDQVVSASEEVKTALAAIDTSQLNAMLRQALKVALDVVTSAIEPPSKVTALVKEQYDTTVKPVTTALIEPIQAQFNAIVTIIDTFRPGNLIDATITPLFEEMMQQVQQLLDPDRLLAQLDGLNQLYTGLLNQLQQINPRTLLEPLVQAYQQLIGFLQQLAPDRLVKMLDDLLEVARQQLRQLPIDQWIDQIVQPVAGVVETITSFRLEEQAFWQPVQNALNTDMQALLAGFARQISSFISQLDLSALDALLAALRSAARTVSTTIEQSTLPAQFDSVVDQTTLAIQSYRSTMTELSDLWQQANGRGATLPPEFQSLNPIKLLAGPSNLIGRIETTLKSLQQKLHTIWQSLINLLKSGGKHLETLSAEQSNGLSGWLSAVFNSFVAGPVAKIGALLNEPLAGMRRAIAAVLGLQHNLDALKIIPESMNRIADAFKSALDALLAFNLNVFSDELKDLTDAVITPLTQAVDLEGLLRELDAIFKRIMDMLESFNPKALLSTARGPVTIRRSAQTPATAITIPSGARLIVETPVGPKQFKILQALTLEAGQESVQAMVQALEAGPAGDIVVAMPATTPDAAAPDAAASDATAPAPAAPAINWRMEMPSLVTLSVANEQRILSLTTLATKVVVEKLEALHPRKTLVEPLNAPYEKILQIKEELALEDLLDRLFERFDSLQDELFEGLDRSAVALGGVLRAIPV